MRPLITEADFIEFANDFNIPLMFMFNEDEMPVGDNIPTVVCFDRDRSLVEHGIPVGFKLISIRNQLDYNQDALLLEYDKIY